MSNKNEYYASKDIQTKIASKNKLKIIYKFDNNYGLILIGAKKALAKSKASPYSNKMVSDNQNFKIKFNSRNIGNFEFLHVSATFFRFGYLQEISKHPVCHLDKMDISSRTNTSVHGR